MKTHHVAALILLSWIGALTGCRCKNSPLRILADSADWEAFGAPLGGACMGVSLDLLVADPLRFDGMTLTVRDGTVESVCKKKGCWMVLRDGRAPVRVTFKDYGFFVPTDCEGRSVMLEGVFTVKTVPEVEARHYLEDAGRHEDALKLFGDQKELSIIATGTRLSR